MAGRRFLYGGEGAGSGGGSGSILLSNKRVHCSSSVKAADSFFVARSSAYQGSGSMVRFEGRGNGSRGQFFQSFEDNGDDEYDQYFEQPEKKRRLTVDQVRFLEKSFEVDNKLEPERKVKLAKDLGLQPRQVAIWFQNRRARWKTKQLEKDYDDLQESYNKLKAHYENLVKEKGKLKCQVDELSDKLIGEAKGTSDSSSTKDPYDLQLCQQILDRSSEKEVSKNTNMEYGQVAKSIEFDIGVQTSLLERGDSSLVFEQEQSDGTLDEEDNFGKIFLSPVEDYTSPRIENTRYTDVHSADSYSLGLLEDDQAFGFWPY